MNLHAGVDTRPDAMPRHGPRAEPPFPIRFDIDAPLDLRQLGEAIAKGERGISDPLMPVDLRARIRDNAETIREVVADLDRAQRAGESLTPASNWMLDNYYLVEEAIAQTRRALSKRMLRKLPPLTADQNIPRVLAIAWNFVAFTDSAITQDGFTEIVEGYQTVEPLKIGELWALPSALRFVLIENLRRLAERIRHSRRMRAMANRVADDILQAGARSEIEIVASQIEHVGDKSFATQMLHRLQDGSDRSLAVRGWLETELEALGSDAGEVALREHGLISSGNVTTANIIKALRLANDIPWAVWFEGVSLIDRMLRERADFALLDFASRDEYRRQIEELAQGAGLEERQTTERIIALAAEENAVEDGRLEIGRFLVGPMRADLERELGYTPSPTQRLRAFVKRSGAWSKLVPVAVVTLLFVIAAMWALAQYGLAAGAMAVLVALFVMPASEAALGLFNTAVSVLVKPTRLIGYEYADGVPPEARTLVAVPTLIGSRDDVEESIHNLEVHYLANMSGALHFAVVSDWPDSTEEQSREDLALLDFARKGIAELNKRYPTSEGPERFFLFHRHRLYNPSEGVWMGWERKRGKLHELNTLLRGDRDTSFFDPGTPLPDDIAYVMTVDADTRMTRDAVSQLVGKLAHPLNRPVISSSGRITGGYGILQPRVTPSLTTGDEASLFQRIFSANRGIDPYVFAVSDVYQDLYGAGTFTGKGLYHIDAMEAALGGRIRENAVLSHDLLEGSFASAALVTDVELIEDYPTRYAVDASRQHRWARGDWQLLSYIFDTGSGLSGLSRWKMIDNLRRSLMPQAWILASIAGWTLLPFTQAVQWQALLVVSLFFSLTYGVVDSILPRDTDATLRNHIATVARDAAFASAQVVMKVVLMAHAAWSMSDAIVRTLYRLFVSRRHLLEWQTASQAARGGVRDVSGHYRLMAGAVVIAIVGLAVPLVAGSTGAAVGAFFAALWIGSPAIAWLVSRSAESEERLVIAPSDATTLRRIARRTWLYFEDFVTDEHHQLPPDNFQDNPQPLVAGRTSPTNIGVYLLSVVSARDFGWISLEETIERIEETMATIETMERHRGHLLNWYDTRSLQPLHPRYVSSVDSGNLAGHLVALAGACQNWANAPAVHLQGDFEGILDVAGILSETLEALPADRRRLMPLRQRLAQRLEGICRAVETIRSEPETAPIRAINLTVLARDIVKLARAIDDETGSPATSELALWAGKLESGCEAHLADSHAEEAGVARLRRRLVALRDRTRQFAFEMDFSFLLRRERKLLSIGYRVEEQELDEACYDLLASEARLTSLFGIAKGDLPTAHWFRLGRPVAELGFRGALVSWSGSMFEYLMPPLVMKEPLGGLLNQTNNLIIGKQMRYAASKGIPWGISEAAFHARDREMNYQYTNFGVPGLGLKRGLGRDLVIAPYASLLACQFRPADAVANLAWLKTLGAQGRYGFHDAVDFTPARVPAGATCAVVHNYYAHHHGMSIVAIDNAIFEGRMRDRFHSDPVIEAAELLLQEKAPRSIPANAIRPEVDEPIKAEEAHERGDIRKIADPINAQKAVTLISNGRYSTMLTATGAGYSMFEDMQVTRWNGDPTCERDGTFLFLTDVETGQCWSATAAPRRAGTEECEAIFSDDRVTFLKSVGSLRTELDCIVAAEVDGEARRLTIHNEGNRDRFIDVTSFAEIALATRSADAAHPAFSKMFVRTHIADEGSTIYAERRRRSPGDRTLALAHFMAPGVGVPREAEAETDRRAFIGRGRTIEDALALGPNGRLTAGQGDVLDPVMSLRCRVRVPKGKKISLTFWTLVADSRAELEMETRRLRTAAGFERQAMLAWTHSQVQTRHVGLSLDDAAAAQRLARFLLYPDPVLRIVGEMPGRQSELWPMSISGDFPIFVLRIGNISDVDIVSRALRMHEYLRMRGLVFDLVILNEKTSSYIQDLQHAIENLCDTFRVRGRELGSRQHIFAVRGDLMGDASMRTLLGAARVVMHVRNGTIQDQLNRAEAALRQSMRPQRPVPRATTSALPDMQERGRARVRPVHSSSEGVPAGLDFWNGYGGFADEGRAYRVSLTGNDVTPQPWINVVATGQFGFHSSAEGASYTWSRNSRDFQITPWSNDPVSNLPGEAFYIHDRDSGRVFSPMAAVVRDPAARYEADFEAGLCSFRAIHGAVETSLEQLLDRDKPAKLSRLTIRNTGQQTLRLRVYGYVEWMLGNDRSRTAASIVTGRDGDQGTLTARNPFSLDYGDSVAFFACDAASQTQSCDRSAFLGREGSVLRPAAVVAGAPMGGADATGADPCAVIAADLEIAPGSQSSIVFVLGEVGDDADANATARALLTADFDARRQADRTHWDGFFSTLQVTSPDKAFDLMVNRWLPYQSLACRIRARSAFYQASGAYGFRDQLQDTLALMLHDPSLAREQILNAAGRQFVEGDVQHWWLPGSGAGVRTTISDDVVWLAYATGLYVETTGEADILDHPIEFLEGDQLVEGQHDAFFQPRPSGEQAPLYEHCARALDLAVSRTGPHGLPLILGGDWNDGMNRVGSEGRGESVWLGWFLLKALHDFALIAADRRDRRRAAAWTRHAAALSSALEEAGWDGQWYRRGYYDDGTPLGSASSDECRIDSIAQSWAVLSNGADEARATQGVEQAVLQLVDARSGAVQLFTPPFEHTQMDPGYIRSYPPGVRENGGQYTHAATWLVVALARLRRADDAWRLFGMLNPINHALDRGAAERYRVEPFVVAADVYSRGELAGRGGWTWYTGSAGWLYRAAVEAILGIRRHGDAVEIDPVIPSDWPGYEARLTIGEAVLDIRVVRGGVRRTEVDGRELPDARVPLRKGNQTITSTIP